MQDRFVDRLANAPAHRSDLPRVAAGGGTPTSFRTCNDALLPLRETMRTRGLRALARTPRERALASRLESTAFQQGASVVQFADALRDASTALWFETRQFGLKLGIAEGIALRSADAA